VNTRGRAFTHGYFGNWFSEQCRRAGLKYRSAHGLRKAAAEWAGENGATTLQLMAIFGWKDMEQAERYTRNANRRRLTGDAPKLLMRPEGEQGVSHLGPAVQASGTVRVKKARKINAKF
jgi:integrase